MIDLKQDGSFRMNQSYFNYCQGLTMTSEKLHDLFGGLPRKSETELTEREMDVLKLVAEGQTNAEIAEALVIGVGTVRTHVSNILAKLHLANRTQAALYALREGLAPLK